MAAITWRNVEGRSLAEAAVPLREAGDLMEKGLGTFDRMLQQRNAVQSNNWDIGKTNNTNELQALIASAKTPEELAALEGQINAKAAGYNGQVDATVLRNGLRDGLTALRTQGTADQQYTAAQREAAAAPNVEGFNNLVASGDWKGALSMVGKVDLGTKAPQLIALARQAEVAENNFNLQKSLMPLNNQTAQANAESGLVTAREGVKTAEGTAKAGDALTDSVARHQGKVENHQLALSSIANEFGIPVVNGNPVFNHPSVTPDMLAKFEASVKANKLDQYVPDGAKAIADLKGTLAASRAPVAVQQQTLGAAGTVLRTGTDLTPEQQGKLDTVAKTLDAEVADTIATNPFYADPKTLLQDQTAALNEIEAMMPKEGRTTVQAVIKNLRTLMNKGVKVTRDGKTVTMPVTPGLIRYVASGNVEADEWFFGRNETDIDIEAAIREMYESKGFDDLIKAADYASKQGNKVQTEQAKRELQANSPMVSPRDQLNALDREIAKRKDKATTGGR